MLLYMTGCIGKEYGTVPLGEYGWTIWGEWLVPLEQHCLNKIFESSNLHSKLSPHVGQHLVCANCTMQEQTLIRDIRRFIETWEEANSKESLNIFNF